MTIDNIDRKTNVCIIAYLNHNFMDECDSVRYRFRTKLRIVNRSVEMFQIHARDLGFTDINELIDKYILPYNKIIHKEKLNTLKLLF